MLDHKFTEADKTKLVDFLNFIATKATFPNWKTEDTVAHFKLLAHIQNIILPKIDANIFEMGKVVQLEKSPEETKEPKSRGK